MEKRKVCKQYDHDQIEQPTLNTGPRELTTSEVAKVSGATTGTVKWFNDSKGFGFITDINRMDVNVIEQSPSMIVALD